MNSRSKETFFNVLSGIITLVIQIMVNFFLSPYIVKNLGEAANGFTQLANNFVSYATLISVAFNSMASRFITVSYHKGEIKKANQYYSSIIACNAVIFAVLAPVSLYLIDNLENLITIGESPVKDVKLLFACVFLNYFANIILSVFSISTFVLNKIFIKNAANLVTSLLNAIFLMCAFSILPVKMYYVSFVALILTIISIPFFYAIQKKMLPILRFSIDGVDIKSIIMLLKSGIWNTINQGGNMLMTGFDLLMANLFIDPVAMGVLSVAKIIPNAVISLANVINNNFVSSITIDWARGKKEDIITNLRMSMKISGIVVSIPVVTFCTFAVPFYSLWQPTLNAYQLAIASILSIVAFIPLAGTQALFNVYTATNKLKVNSLSFCFCGIINIITVFLLLRYTSWGIFAIAGVSSLLTIIRNCIVTIPYTAKLLEVKWYSFYKEVLISLICALVNFVVAFTIGSVFVADSWYILIIDVIITCIFTFTVEIFIVLNRNERSFLISKIRRK